MKKAVITVAVLMGLAATSVAWAAEDDEPKLGCWKAAIWDLDSDGYAAYDAPANQREFMAPIAGTNMHCPKGWVRFRGDCDDTRDDVHPRQPETYGNLRDDNCDGRIDEPAIVAYPDGNGNWKHGFSLHVLAHHEAVLDAWERVEGKNGELALRVTAVSLDDTEKERDLGRVTVTALDWNGEAYETKIDVAGLDPFTVYRVRVQFEERVDTPAGPMWVAVGQESGWHTTMTTSDVYTINKARVGIVLQALYEASRSELGEVGYKGDLDIDGLRYGADWGESWCSEFYSYAASTELANMGHQPFVSKIINYFEDYGTFMETPGGEAPMFFGQPGDYLAEDTNGDGKKNHSAMFLAYDRFLDVYWTVDGNTNGSSDIGGPYASRRGGNEAFVRTRSVDNVAGWGRLDASML